MKIQSVDRDINKNGRYLALFDDGSSVSISSAHIADFGICPGRELSDGEYSELIEGIELSKAKARAVRILGNRCLSAHEIKKRLVNKGDSEEAAQKTADWLEESGLVNDAQYAEAIVRHYCAKGYGPARVKAELFKRGIPREMWDSALAGLDDANMESAMGGFLEKKLGGSEDSDDLRRAADALTRRGFTYEQVRTAVNSYLGTVRE